MTAAGQVIQIKEIGTVSILLAGNTTIKLHNIALTLRYNSNLILLGQIQESDITYHNNTSIMTLLRSSKVIIHTRRSHNLFTLNLTMPGQIMSAIGKAMVITGQGQPTHFINKNKHICL